jgi:hypothetical protein
VTAGSSCIVNAYTSNHEIIASKETGAFKGFVLHAIDAVGLVHALLLRIQALLLPIKTLVLSGRHLASKERYMTAFGKAALWAAMISPAQMCHRR